MSRKSLCLSVLSVVALILATVPASAATLYSDR